MVAPEFEYKVTKKMKNKRKLRLRKCNKSLFLLPNASNLGVANVKCRKSVDDSCSKKIKKNNNFQLYPPFPFGRGRG